MDPDEEATVRAFIAPARRRRYLEFLASPKRRRRFLDRLNHCRDIDERFATSIRSNVDVAALLRQRGAPETCYVISDTSEIDGQRLGPEEAIERSGSALWGTLISCIPGKLAYYYDECGARRMVLERNLR